MLLGWVSVGGGLVATRPRLGSGCGRGVKAGAGGRRRRNLGRQGMGSQAHFHQRLRVRQAGNTEAVLFLVTLHRVASGFIPIAGRLLVKLPGLNQGPLDFLDALRLRPYKRTPGSIMGLRDLTVLCCLRLRSTVACVAGGAFDFVWWRTVLGFVACVFDGALSRST